MKTIVGAAAGYQALYWNDDLIGYASEPIIAWRIEDSGEFVSAEAIGIDGLCNEMNATLLPDGRVNWIERTFDSVEDCLQHVREESEK